MSDLDRTDGPLQDLSYYAARAAAERQRAATAVDDRARAAHEELAAKYEAMVRAGVAND